MIISVLNFFALFIKEMNKAFDKKYDIEEMWKFGSVEMLVECVLLLILPLPLKFTGTMMFIAFHLAVLSLITLMYNDL